MRALGMKHGRGEADRRRNLPALSGVAVVVLAALAGVVPVTSASAAPSEAKLEVNENCVAPDWPCWATPGSSQPASKVTIAGGGSVTFVDDKTAANIAWTGSAPTCDAGVPVAPTAPKTGWEGKCTFTTPGTYKFESSTLWPEYTRYEIVVEGSATGTTGESGTAPGTAPGASPVGGSPGESALSGAPKISSRQQGSAVKGSLQISKAGAGSRLEIDLVATAASLGKAGHKSQVVGRLMTSSVGAGRRSFSVKLNAAGRRALESRNRLALKVKVTLTPTDGSATTVSRSVTLQMRTDRKGG